MDATKPSLKSRLLSAARIIAQPEAEPHLLPRPAQQIDFASSLVVARTGLQRKIFHRHSLFAAIPRLCKWKVKRVVVDANDCLSNALNRDF
jgi:hypothetical protein